MICKSDAMKKICKMAKMRKIEAGLGKDVKIIAPPKGNIKESVRHGREILLQEWKEGKLPGYYSNIITKIKGYKPGTNKKADAALYYLDSSVSDYSNRIPRRVKVEIGIQNLEGILR